MDLDICFRPLNEVPVWHAWVDPCDIIAENKLLLHVLRSIMANREHIIIYYHFC